MEITENIFTCMICKFHKTYILFNLHTTRAPRYKYYELVYQLITSTDSTSLLQRHARQLLLRSPRCHKSEDDQPSHPWLLMEINVNYSVESVGDNESQRKTSSVRGKTPFFSTNFCRSFDSNALRNVVWRLCFQHLFLFERSACSDCTF